MLYEIRDLISGNAPSPRTRRYVPPIHRRGPGTGFFSFGAMKNAVCIARGGTGSGIWAGGKHARLQNGVFPRRDRLPFAMVRDT
jgi:hypothetical protein